MVVSPILGVLAGVMSVANTVPYVRDVVRGSTRPHRGSWLIWAVTAIFVYASQRADGASWSLIMAGAQAVLTAFVFLLAIRRGEVTSLELTTRILARIKQHNPRLNAIVTLTEDAALARAKAADEARARGEVGGRHEVLVRVHGGLRLAGAPGRELPDRDVVLRGRRRLEFVGQFRQALLTDNEHLP
mgnify:CR=1 FL=1